MINNSPKLLTILIISVVFVFSSFTLTLCKEKDKQSRLKLKRKISIKVPEPSGIEFNKKDNSLLIVSDESNRIYKLSSNGEVLDSLEVNGFDLEGITLLNDSTLATILERDRTVVILNDKGKELYRFNIDLYGKPNSGLEGITFNPNKKHLYVLNEKNPGLLIELGLDGELFSKRELSFASDFSGSFYDSLKNELWITSHENKSIYKCTTNGVVLNTYAVDVPQVEGIAIDFETKSIFIVCDKTESLFIYSLP